MAVILIVVLVAGASAFIMQRNSRIKAKKRGSDLVKEIFAIWARLGPFKTGEESARAMSYAQRARNIQVDEASIEAHAVKFNEDPAAWEQTRLEYIAERFPKFSELEVLVEQGRKELAINS